MCKHTQVHFSPDCSFKICEKPFKVFQKCLRSHCRVGVVNDYTTLTTEVIVQLKLRNVFCEFLCETAFACLYGAQVEFFFLFKKVLKIS